MQEHIKKLPVYMVNLYLVLMLGVFPLYYRNRYYNMGDVKYEFFRNATVIMLAGVAAAVLVGLVWKDNRRAAAGFFTEKVNLLDGAVLCYGAAAVISWRLSPFQEQAWVGSGEWYMGLLSQLLFIGIYFVMKQSGIQKQWPLWVMGISGAAVYVLAYLHRFRIDPLGLYEGLADYYQILFLGTIGQATWYSSYLCVVLPVMMGVYMTAGQGGSRLQRFGHKLAGVFLFLGAATAVTQNSDSIYVGLLAALLFLLWFALEDFIYWKRYMQMLVIGLTAVKLTGLLQLSFPQQVPALEPFSLRITQGSGTWIALAASVGLYGLTCWQERRAAKAGRNAQLPGWIKRVRLGMYILAVAGALSVLAVMWLATTGRITIDSGLWQETGYLVFNEEWGNGRGKSWLYAVSLLKEYPLAMKLFGCGPDAMTFYSDAFHQEEIAAMWGGLKLTNAHNEWLTAFVDYGIVGGAAYLSVFAAAVVTAVRRFSRQPVLLAAGAAVLSYVGHNFFCYQQTVCTPLIFLVIGAAAGLCRVKNSVFLKNR